MTHTQINSRILVLDFGSQYTSIIARRVRELEIYCEVLPFDCDIEAIKSFNPQGIILSGGPESVYEDSHYAITPEIFCLKIPILGICYGMQLMAKHFGGIVNSSNHREFGHAVVDLLSKDGILAKVFDKYQASLEVWMSHGDQVIEPPKGFAVTAKTKTCPISVIENADIKCYGLQFHPEVTHTQGGIEIISSFAFDICGCDKSWNKANIIAKLVDDIKTQVGGDEVILGLSGGVDSSVLAALLHKAIGKQLTCIFVDTGLLRLNEAEYVLTTFNNYYPEIKVLKIDASEEFFSALQGVLCPEKKRKVIGELFIKIFEEQANNLRKNSNVKWLAQGTIYSDVIESAGNKNGKGHVIKSHHNVGGLPNKMNLLVLEPLRELFKDEVRAIGVKLGLPEQMVNRHPFPGPGLGVRIVGEVKKEYVNILAQADDIFIQELNRFGLYYKTSQAFAVFLPVKSVGVMGDCRKYEWVIALRAVESIDFMTATNAYLPYELLSIISNRIVNEISGISRVVYDISSKPPATIEWE